VSFYWSLRDPIHSYERISWIILSIGPVLFAIVNISVARIHTDPDIAAETVGRLSSSELKWLWFRPNWSRRDRRSPHRCGSKRQRMIVDHRRSRRDHHSLVLWSQRRPVRHRQVSRCSVRLYSDARASIPLETVRTPHSAPLSSNVELSKVGYTHPYSQHTVNLPLLLECYSCLHCALWLMG